MQIFKKGEIAFIFENNMGLLKQIFGHYLLEILPKQVAIKEEQLKD